MKSRWSSRIIRPTRRFNLSPTLRIEIIKTRRRGIFRKVEYVCKLIQSAARDCDICVATSSRTPLYIMASLLLTRNRPKLMYSDSALRSFKPRRANEPPLSDSQNRWRRLSRSATGFRSGRSRFPVGFANRLKNPPAPSFPNGVDLSAFSPADASPPRTRPQNS